MQPTELTKEGELFFRQYLRSPRSVGSIIPSSRALGRGVAAETAWEPGQYVVELGGGTGSITMGLIERGHSARPAVRDRARRPDARLPQGAAARVSTSSRAMRPAWTRSWSARGRTSVSTVDFRHSRWSGNPIELRRAIVGQGMKVVRPGGFMLQYSYSPIAPIPAKEFGVEAKLARYVLWNFPPASVWRYTAKPA